MVCMDSDEKTIYEYISKVFARQKNEEKETF